MAQERKAAWERRKAKKRNKNKFRPKISNTLRKDYLRRSKEEEERPEDDYTN